MLLADASALRQHHAALDDVAQLAHVAGPRVGLERLPRLVRQSLDLGAVAAVAVIDEARHQQRDVLEPIAQRRQMQAQHIEAVVEVLAELALLDRVLGILVGGGEVAHVDLDLAVPADPAHLAVLEHAQQLGLERDRHLGDLVEEERPAVRHLEAALALPDGAGERALLVAEDLALHQLGRDRGAVDGVKRRRGSPRQRVDGVGGDFLAGAALAGDQHRDVGGGHLADHLEDVAHRLAGAHQLAEALRPRRRGELSCIVDAMPSNSARRRS